MPLGRGFECKRVGKYLSVCEDRDKLLFEHMEDRGIGSYNNKEEELIIYWNVSLWKFIVRISIEKAFPCKIQ